MLESMIWPAPGVTAEHLAATLSNFNGMPRPILVGANSGDQVITKYLQWVNDADRLLGSVLRKADLDRLVYTPRYWATLTNPIPTPAVVGAVRQETEQRERDLDAALKEARELRDHWTADPRGTQVVVPDTGVFLNHAEEENGRFDIGTIAWRSLAQARIFDEIRVVVPIVVIDELELIKDNRSIAQERRNKARWTVSTLFDWFELEPGSWHLLPERTAQVGPVAIEVLPDERGHQRLPRNDDELVDRAVVLKEVQAAPVHFLSYDTGAVFRANLAGLTGHRLQDQGLPRRNGSAGQ
jgi:hypothetical protein